MKPQDDWATLVKLQSVQYSREQQLQKQQKQQAKNDYKNYLLQQQNDKLRS